MNSYKAILIVEDDKLLLATMAKSFANLGFVVATASSKVEAEAALKKIHPTHALLDLKIGEDFGLSLISLLKNFDANIKIVVLTGYASISTTIEAIKLGACYYLSKPAMIDDIISAFDGENFAKKEPKIGKKTSIKNVEWEHINKVLSEFGFNISKAARVLGMHRKTLARKLQKRVIK